MNLIGTVQQTRQICNGADKVFPPHQEQLLEKQTKHRSRLVYLASQKVETTHMSIHSGVANKTWNIYTMGHYPQKRMRCLEKGMATHSDILAWRIPWTEEPGRLHIVHRVARSRTRLSDAHSLTQSSPFFFFKKLYPCKDQ